MRNVPRMAIFNSLNNLGPELSGLILWQVPIRFRLDLIKKTTTVDKFHNKKNLLSGFKNFIKLSYVWMVEFIQNFHLPFN